MKTVFLFVLYMVLSGSNRGLDVGIVGIYAATCITNELDCSVNYAYRWGNGAWQTTSLPSNNSNTHTMPYQGSSRSSPELYVRFECDLSSSTSYKEYCLERYQSNTTDCCDARKYAFQQSIDYPCDFNLFSLPD